MQNLNELSELERQLEAGWGLGGDWVEDAGPPGQVWKNGNVHLWAGAGYDYVEIEMMSGKELDHPKGMMECITLDCYHNLIKASVNAIQLGNLQDRWNIISEEGGRGYYFYSPIRRCKLYEQAQGYWLIVDWNGKESAISNIPEHPIMFAVDALVVADAYLDGLF